MVTTDILKLSKYRLGTLVALTATTGFLLRSDNLDPNPTISNTAQTPVLRPLLATTIGTFLTSASSNTLNQLYEIRTDALMKRTRFRPLPSCAVSPPFALAFAALSATGGLGLLAWHTNSTACLVAATYLVLYAAVYTPLKRISTVNTWIGAVVGALPPLIGWSAASQGSLFDKRDLGGWTFAAFLFLWQIPYFHALAVALRNDYARAGLQMLAVSNPALNARWASVTALALFPICPAMHATGVVAEAFVWQSGLLSLWMYRMARQLENAPLNTSLARGLFKASILHLPVCMTLLLANRASIGTDMDLKVDARDQSEENRQIEFRQPWEVIAPFPFLPVPRGAPAVVLDPRDC